jgi:hypothetical protein
MVQTHDDRDPSGVQNGEDDIRLPADVADRRRRDVHDNEITNPVGRSTY